jgi:hypothetical protein
MKRLCVVPSFYFIIGVAAGNEVGLSMVRTSPLLSWTRGASITPNGAKGQQCPGARLLDFFFNEVPTLAAVWKEKTDGSHV